MSSTVNCHSGRSVENESTRGEKIKSNIPLHETPSISPLSSTMKGTSKDPELLQEKLMTVVWKKNKRGSPWNRRTRGGEDPPGSVLNPVVPWTSKYPNGLSLVQHLIQTPPDHYVIQFPPPRNPSRHRGVHTLVTPQVPELKSRTVYRHPSVRRLVYSEWGRRRSPRQGYSVRKGFVRRWSSESVRSTKFDTPKKPSFEVDR